MSARVALVHHWLVAMRGGERLLEALAHLFPEADVFTLVCDRSRISQTLRQRNIHTSFIQRLPGAGRWYRYYLPLFPLATQVLDAGGYDVVISSDAATVKGVRTGNAIHICYCHTPMRYVWEGYASYCRASGPIARQALRAVRRPLRAWDFQAAQRVTHFVANSRNVQRRIRDCYGRDSRVIYPPVDTDRFCIDPTGRRDGGFLVVSQLVPYKRIDLLVQAFNKSQRRLTIIGDGPERRRLEALARPNIRFLGMQPDAAVVKAMQWCDAFVFPGEEDFGIVLAEAQACGTPVIAFARGGAPEIVKPEMSGILFEEQSVDCLLDALDRFDRMSFDALTVRQAALRFGSDRFLREFGAFAGAVCRLDASSAPVRGCTRSAATL